MAPIFLSMGASFLLRWSSEVSLPPPINLPPMKTRGTCKGTIRGRSLMTSRKSFLLHPDDTQMPTLSLGIQLRSWFSIQFLGSLRLFSQIKNLRPLMETYYFDTRFVLIIQPWWLSSLGRQLSFSRSWRHKQANGGSNPIEVWCINRSGGETPCCNSHCRTPGSVKSCL